MEPFLISIQEHSGQTLFLSVAVVTFLYAVVTKRGVDFLTLSYFGALIYFLPGFWGFTYYLSGDNPVYVPISNPAYAVMAIVLTLITIGIKVCHPSEVHFIPSRLVSAQYWSLLIVCATSLVMLYFARGDNLFAASKDFLLGENGSRWLTLFEAAAFASIVTALYSGRKRYFLLALLTAPVDLYLGFRVVTAFAGAAFIYTHLARKGRLRLFTQWRLLLVLLTLLYGLLLYKQLHYASKAQDTDLLLRLINDKNTYSHAIIHSEPFVVTNTLNFATQTPFDIDSGYIWRWPLSLIPFLPELGGMDSSQDFSAQFLNVILPGLSYGVGGNPWAELYLMGLLPLVALGALSYVAVLRLISKCAASSRFAPVQLAAVAVGSIWCFYFNRNEIFFQLNMTRNAIFMCFLGWLLGRCWPSLRAHPLAPVSWEKLVRSTSSRSALGKSEYRKARRTAARNRLWRTG